MGAWGTGLSSNDTFCDVYEEFFSMFNEGKEVDEITSKLMEIFYETIRCEEDHTNFWFALAKAQWECKSLSPVIFEKVKSLIEDEEDIRIWKGLGADEKDIKARKKVLCKFLNTISKEKENPKKRKKIRFKSAIFQKGDCIAFRFENGKYGGALVLEMLEGKEAGLNFIVKTRINQEHKPSLNDFKTAEVLIRQIAQYENGECITKEREDAQWYFPDGYKKHSHLFEVIGRLETSKYIDTKKEMTFSGGWDLIISQTAEQFENEKTGLFIERKIRLIDFIEQ